MPTVVGAVSRPKPVFVEDAKFLRRQTTQPIKWALPGPMTMIDTLYDAHYKSREKLAWEFAKILNEEAKELEAAGVDIIQFDEPAFNVFFDEVNDWGVATLERAVEGLKCQTAVHICYGYGIKANTDWKQTLGSEWRQYEESFPKLQTSSIDIISLECQNSHVPIDLIELVRGKKVMVGAIDVASNTVERRKTWPTRCAGRCSSWMPTSSTRAPTAAWHRWRVKWHAASCARSAKGPGSCVRSFRRNPGWGRVPVRCGEDGFWPGADQVPPRPCASGLAAITRGRGASASLIRPISLAPASARRRACCRCFRVSGGADTAPGSGALCTSRATASRSGSCGQSRAAHQRSA